MHKNERNFAPQKGAVYVNMYMNVRGKFDIQKEARCMKIDTIV